MYKNLQLRALRAAFSLMRQHPILGVVPKA
jgi:hypothetical protein